MNIATIIILGHMIVFVSADGKMDYTQCDIFIDKLGSDSNAISFKGSVSIDGDGDDVMIEISYIDKYYLDSSLFGLVTEDGKTPETTCLDLKIYRYYDGLTNSVLVNDLSVTNAHDDANRSRSYILTFKANEFKNKLNETISTSYYTYSGTYAFVFKLSQDPWQIKYIYRFSFQIKLNRETRKILDTQFNSIKSDSVQNCNNRNDLSFNLQAASSLVFCQDLNCTKIFPKTPILYVNENIILLQNTTTLYLEKYIYFESEIYLEGDGLLIKAAFDRVVYDSSIGYAIYNVKVKYAWNKLRIRATTRIVSPKDSLLTLSDTDTVTAYSEETCISVQGEVGCPTCAIICKVNNGDAPYDCDCSLATGAQILLLAFIFVLLVF